jgi:hypothetical protein
MDGQQPALEVFDVAAGTALGVVPLLGYKHGTQIGNRALHRFFKPTH